jgi:transposase
MSKTADDFAAFIGLDWADRKHDVCLHAPGLERFERGVLEHRPAAIEAWAHALEKRFGGKPIAIGLELSRGPIVSALLEYDFFILFPINPTTVAQYRRAFTPSHAKDDPTDAEIALDLLLRHRDKLKPLRPESTAMRSLQRLVETRRSFVQDRVRITNRITHALKAYFPQVLSWFRDKETAVFANFLERWPTLEAAQRARDETLTTFFHTHNVRHKATVARRLEAIRSERALTSDAAVVETSVLIVESLLPQLRAVSAAIERFDREIARLCTELPDYDIFRALPGAGAVFSARLLAAFGEQRERFPNAAAVQRCVGVAPVTERSGNKSWVHWRFRASKFLRQTFVGWVGETVPRSFWARAFYERKRATGASHGVAIRALAFKWVRILYRCWVDRTLYDESRYLLALQKRHSPLLKFAAEKG